MDDTAADDRTRVTNSSAAPARLHANVVESVSRQAWLVKACVTVVITVTNVVLITFNRCHS